MFVPVKANDVRFCEGVVASPVAGCVVAGAAPSCWLMSHVVGAITRGGAGIAPAGGCSSIITYVVLLLLMVMTLRCGCCWTSTKNENEKGDDNKIVGQQQQKQNLDSTSILGPFFLNRES